MSTQRAIFPILIMTLFLSVGGLLHAANHTPLDYTLEVSIDVPSSKILGVASIKLKAGETVTLQRGPSAFATCISGEEFAGAIRRKRSCRSRPGEMACSESATRVSSPPWRRLLAVTSGTDRPYQ